MRIISENQKRSCSTKYGYFEKNNYEFNQTSSGPVRQRSTKKKASMKQKLGLCMINDEFLFSVLQLL